MKQYGVIIIEDERRNQSLISNYIYQNFSDLKVLAICETVVDSINKIKDFNPDIILSDIELPDGTAFDIFVETKNYIKSLVFLTAFDQYGIKAIKCSAIDYLLKPIMLEEFIDAINKCKEKLRLNQSIKKQLDVLIENNNHPSDNNIIAIPNGNIIELASPKDIIYLKAEGNYTSIFLTENRKRLVTKSISHFDQLLPQNIFFRVHVSYILNVKQIKEYHKGRSGIAVMVDGSEIEIAARRIKSFSEFIKL